MNLPTIARTLLPGFFKTESGTCVLLLMLSLAFPFKLAAEERLIPHTAEYKVKISVLGGRLRTRVEAVEGGYRAESSIEATGMSRLIARGSIRESSEIRMTDTDLRPQRFVSVDTLSRDGESADLEFDWAARLIEGTINGEAFNTEIHGVLHDRVSLQYGLMDDLLRGVERTQYSLQDAEKLKVLTITNVGRKPVKVPFGRFEAVGIQHQAANSSRITTLWCAEELGFLPVVIEQHRKGKRQMRAVLTEYRALD